MKIKLTALVCSLFAFYFSNAQLKAEDIKIDTAITGFHFAANFEGTMVYTKNGPSDINTNNPSAFSFTVLKDVTYDSAKSVVKQYLGWSLMNGFTHTDAVEKDTTINGNKVFYVTLTETQKGTDYKNLVCNGFIMKGETAILFISGDLSGGKYIDGFKKTLFATKF